MTLTLKANDKDSWFATIWRALESYRENSIPEGADPAYDEEWSDICTAMAWIRETLGLPDEIDTLSQDATLLPLPTAPAAVPAQYAATGERRDYFAAHAPADIPAWFQFDTGPKPVLPHPGALSGKHAKQWGVDGWLDESDVDPEVLAFRERYHAAFKATDQYEAGHAQARFIAWRWHYADMMLAASTSPASAPNADFTHTALCIWEYLLEHGETNDTIKSLKHEIGTVELRHTAINLTPFCQQVYAALPDPITLASTYDWDVVPAILETIDWSARPIMPLNLAEATQTVRAALANCRS